MSFAGCCCLQLHKNIYKYAFSYRQWFTGLPRFSRGFPVSSHRESLQDVLGLIVRKIKWKIVNIDSYRIIGRDGT